MQFFSTRDHNRVVSASQAIAQGLSDEGGLFVPQSFPQVDVKAICALDYPEMAAASWAVSDRLFAGVPAGGRQGHLWCGLWRKGGLSGPCFG